MNSDTILCTDTAPDGSSSPARLTFYLRVAPRLWPLALIALPKCPLCVAAYAGVLGSVGSACLRAAWGLPLTVALLLGALAVPAMRAWRRHGYRPLLSGLAGACALLLGKFAVGSTPLVATGAALLAGAALWSARLDCTSRAPLGGRS